MALRLCRHLDTGLVCPQYAECPGPHFIPRQNIQTEVPVQDVVGLSQVEEDGMEDRIPYGYELLE